MGEERKVYRVWWESLKVRDHSERPRSRWEDKIRMDVGETGCWDALHECCQPVWMLKLFVLSYAH
jgi:hypothetical protein